jgi:hypothetical protein
MAEHIRDDEHDVRRLPDRKHDQTSELLCDSEQHQSLEDSTDALKRPKSLLDLPLVLVRKILQDIVQCYTIPQHRTMQLFALLDVRRVHSKSAPYSPFPMSLICSTQDSSMPK